MSNKIKLSERWREIQQASARWSECTNPWTSSTKTSMTVTIQQTDHRGIEDSSRICRQIVCARTPAALHLQTILSLTVPILRHGAPAKMQNSVRYGYVPKLFMRKPNTVQSKRLSPAAGKRAARANISGCGLPHNERQCNAARAYPVPCESIYP